MAFNIASICRTLALGLPLVALAGCGEVSFAQKNSPANAYKDYRPENRSNSAVIGMGEPISTRQMRANATISIKGLYDAEQVMQKLAGTYNVAVRWGNGVRKGKRQDVLMNNLSFDEARSYVEDVYDVQIIREGERRLLVLPSASEPRVQSFKPGENVTLATALRGLADQCGYNLVITENREQLANTRVTTNMKDITCFDAFESLLTPYGLSFINAGDYYTIGGLPQRQWSVPLDEPVRAESVEVNYSNTFGSGEGGEGSAATQSAGGTNRVTVTGTRDLWRELQENLQTLITNACPRMETVAAATANADGSQDSGLLPPPTMNTTTQNQSNEDTTSTASSDANGPTNPACGYVRVNRSVGLVQMRAPKAVLEEADDIISRVTDIANRRIMLEARVLAVSRSRDFQQNSNLSTSSLGFLNKGGGSAGFLSPTGMTGSYASRLVSALTSENGTGGGFVGVRTQNLEALVKLLESYGTTYELMHPMIELMDRQRATLIDGRNEIYFTREVETETNTTTTLRNLTATRHDQFVGLQFTATAQISSDEEPHTISLQIPMTSIVDQAAMTQTFDNETITDQIPVVATRLIDQKVRVRDGEIKVIGGLTKTMAFDRESGMPLIREVPVAGKLLNDENVTYEKVEFVVLLQVRKIS